MFTERLRRDHGIVAPTRADRVRRDLGRRVAELRRTRDLTQEDLAEKLEVTPRYLQSIEAGRENLGLDSLVKLATALRVRVAELFTPPTSREVTVGRPKRLR